MFLADEKNTYGVFNFEWLAKEHCGLSELCLKDVLATMDDFKDEMRHISVHKYYPDEPEKCKFEVSIIYGSLRDEAYVEMVEEHKAKKRRTTEEVAKEKKEEEKPKEDAEPHPGTLGINAPPPLRREASVCA